MKQFFWLRDFEMHILFDLVPGHTSYQHKWFQESMKAEKKYPKECEEARQDSFKRIIDFIDSW